MSNSAAQFMASDRFQNILGLSCVENHVLLFLMQNGIDIRPLYEDSLISLSDMIKEKIVFGKKYTDKGSVPRIHEHLSEAGYLLMKPENKNAVSLLKYVSKHEKDKMTLIQVTPKFAKTVLHTRGWRNDHFVRIVDDKGRLLMLNDIPSLWHPIELKELSKSYVGRLLRFELINKKFTFPPNVKAIDKLYSPQNFNIEKDLCDSCVSMQKLYNLLLYYKTMRYRTKDYVSLFTDTEFMYESLNKTEALFMTVSYMMLRNQYDFESEYRILKQLCDIESEMLKALKDKLNAAVILKKSVKEDERGR